MRSEDRDRLLRWLVTLSIGSRTPGGIVAGERPQSGGTVGPTVPPAGSRGTPVRVRRRPRGRVTGTRPPRTQGAREARLERQGFEHRVFENWRRMRRRDLAREMVSVAMGSGTVGAGAGVMAADAGAAPAVALVVGVLAAVAFGWVLGRDVLDDLIHS